MAPNQVLLSTTTIVQQQCVELSPWCEQTPTIWARMDYLLWEEKQILQVRYIPCCGKECKQRAVSLSTAATSSCTLLPAPQLPAPCWLTHLGSLATAPQSSYNSPLTMSGPTAQHCKHPCKSYLTMLCDKKTLCLPWVSFDSAVREN